MRRHPVLATALCLALAGCASDLPAAAEDPTTAATGGPELHIATAFYPLSYLAGRLAGDTAHVEDLTAAGTEPHDLELTPRQVAGLDEADLVLHLAGFQPSVDRAVEQQAPDAALDVGSVTPLEPGYVPLEGGVSDPCRAGPGPARVAGPVAVRGDRGRGRRAADPAPAGAVGADPRPRATAPDRPH
jgi:zinc transport system substrate-binding protein